MTKKRQLGLTKLMFAVLISLSIVSCQKAPVAGGFTVAPGHQVEFPKAIYNMSKPPGHGGLPRSKMNMQVPTIRE